MKNEGFVRIGTIGDLHLNHSKNSTSETIRGLDKYVTNERVFRTLDYFFIEGDVFDKLMDVADPRFQHIVRWVARTLHIASKYDVVVRVLEGTGLHDRKQSHIFESIRDSLDSMGVHVNVKYIKEVSLETLPCGRVIAYVPDEMGPPDATVHNLRTMLKGIGRDSADMALMHGSFKYQLPVKHPMSHDEDIYSELIRGPIFIGHIHTHSIRGNVVASGSFDRGKQAEEEPKGFTITEVSNVDNDFTVRFIENKLAHRYVGIHITTMEMEDIFIEISNKLGALSLPQGANVCVYMEKKSILSSNMSLLRDRYPVYNWDFIIKTDKKENSDVNKVATFSKREYKPVILNSETLPSLTNKRLIDLALDHDVKGRCIDLLKECL